MPENHIKTGFIGPDGEEEVLVEYLCDQPDCPNTATQVIGAIVELRVAIAFCDDCYKKMIEARKKASE